MLHRTPARPLLPQVRVMLRHWWRALCAVSASAGLGLLVWLGISIALLQGRGADMALLRSMQHDGLIMAGLLALLAIVALRATPATRWRAICIASLALTLVSAATLLALLTAEMFDPGWMAVAAALLTLGALTAVLATGMVQAANGRPGWRQQMVPPNTLAYALLAGSALLFALLALKLPGQGLLSAPAPSLIMLLLVMAALKLLYWFENGGLRTAAGNYTASESLRLRLLVLAVLAVVPLLLACAAFTWPQAAPRLGWWLIAVSVLAGGVLEQVLLAAEASERTGSASATADAASMG